MMGKLCIYHGNCADGFGAAWAVRQALGNIEFYPGVYQKEPPDVAGKDVIMVDFSYKRPVLEEMSKRANSIIILDHHKSAAEDLADFLTPPPWPVWKSIIEDKIPLSENTRITALFDMDRSGAMMAWQYLNNSLPPKLIDHIQDRDLWRFDLPFTREIQAAVFSYPYDFETWDKLMDMDTDKLRQEGTAIERKHHKDIDELLGVCQRRLIIGGYNVPVASLPYTLTSDAGHKMAQDELFAACYWDTAETRIFSLRSTDDGMDVSAIAKSYGGGGHRNASGFAVPREHELAKG